MEVCVRYSYLLREVGETLVSEVEKGWLLLLLLLLLTSWLAGGDDVVLPGQIVVVHQHHHHPVRLAVAVATTGYVLLGGAWLEEAMLGAAAAAALPICRLDVARRRDGWGDGGGVKGGRHLAEIFGVGLFDTAGQDVGGLGPLAFFGQ